MKTKTSLWLGVCTLVLCLGVMITGVYSAISANLNIGGTLGFNMHNCMVTVSGTIQNLAQKTTSGNVSYADLKNKEIETTIMGGENTTTANLSFGELYFFQYDNSNVYDIIIELSFTNISSTAIKATFPAPTVGNGVTLVTDSASGYSTLPLEISKIEINDTYTVKFALHLNSLDSLANNVNFSWNNITFEEYVRPLQGNDVAFNLTANNASIDVTGTKNGYSTGGSSYQTTRQNILMDTDNTIRVTNADGKGTTETVNVGTLNFSDTAPIQPIVLTLTATNKSSTQVASMIVIDEITDTKYTIEYAKSTSLNATRTAYEEAVILNANASITFTITLTSTNPEEVSTNDLIISTYFTKYDANIEDLYNDEIQGLTYTLNDAGTAWSVKGGDTDSYGDDFNSKLKVKDVKIAEQISGLPVTTISDYAFGASMMGSDISTIYIPNTVTSIGDFAFGRCESLTSATIPDSVTSIGNWAFRNCNSLTSITIPDSVTSIGVRAFFVCRNLTSVTIGDSVESIGDYAFGSCTSLESVSLGNSVESIGYGAFDYCTSLTSAYIDGETALATAVSTYSTSAIFYYPTAVYIQKDVNMSGYTKFTKQGTDEYSYNGKIYYKYTETY